MEEAAWFTDRRVSLWGTR